MMDKVEDLPGVGAATAEKLISAGYDTFLSIAVTSPGEMVNIAGVTEATARKIINAARGKLEMGFETGDITEVYGAYGSGKTSIAHQLTVNVQLPKDKGGAEGMAVWIDSEGTIRPEYIAKLAEVQGLDSKEALKNFRGVRSFNSDHQVLLAEKVEELIKEGLPVKLIIIDSLMGHFRSDFSGRGELATRQQKLNKHLHTLMKLASQYNLAIYVTNQVMAKPDTFFGDPTEAIGGHVLHHASTYRVYLRRGKKGTSVAKLVDAPALPESESIFQVTDEGIKDV